MIKFSELPVLNEEEILDSFTLPVEAIKPGLCGKGKSKVRTFRRIVGQEQKLVAKQAAHLGKVDNEKLRKENAENYARQNELSFTSECAVPLSPIHTDELAIDLAYLKFAAEIGLKIDLDDESGLDD
jgi:hypothetical protein